MCLIRIRNRILIFVLIGINCINLLLANLENGQEVDPSSSYRENLLPNCDNDFGNTKNYLIAITLNGKISIIDAVWGTIKWSKQIQSHPLISSTIGNVMKIHNNNGELVQILPSLDGNLYIYHGDMIKKTQFSAEKLLKSSLKFNKNIFLVGGQESKIIGLNLNSGDVIYNCGHFGCSNDNKSTTSENVVLLRKKSQSVRAINTLTGKEEWHFIVDDPQVLKIINQECHSGNNNDSPYTITFKVIPPNGRIDSLVHFSNDSSHSELFNSWTLGLDSPIVNIWHLQNDNLIKINLFDPDINSFDAFVPKNGLNQPYFYLGSFNNHFYIQTFTFQTSDDNELVAYYEDNKIAKRQAFIPVDAIIMDKKNNETVNNTQLMVERRFPFLGSITNSNATGYFVFQYDTNEDKCSSSNFVETHEDYAENIIIEIVYTSLSYYWKEILCLCMIFSAAVNTLWCLFKKCLLDFFKKKSPDEHAFPALEEKYVKKETKLQYDAPVILNRPDESNHFISRYLEDFEQLSLLGKGGFGMVFEAKHKIDESHYAVKRITIPAIEEKRHRFMREIRALSKLDHVNIVRYYNAWVEEPPFGWQEQQDRLQNYDLTSTLNNETITNKNSKNFNLEESSESSQSQDSLNVVFEECSNECIKQKTESKDSLEIIFEECSTSHIKQISEKNVNALIRKSKSKISESNKSIIKSKKRGFLSIPKAYMYIQMQLCKKETLKDWLFQNKKRDKKVVKDIFVQLLKAVNYVHSNNLIHRDLKPSNIFFSMDGLVKIGDFGLVTTIVDEHCDQENLGSLRKHHIKHTNRVGTQLYMSPEQIKNEPYDHKVDIFSMGIIFYELLMPFNTESERIHQLQNVRSKIFPDIFQEKYFREKTIIQELMADSPKDRPESAEILLYNVFNVI